MKKLNTLIILLPAVFILSCHLHHRHVVIASHSNNSDIRLEYEGSVAISSDRTKIEAIGRDGYVDYKRNSDELRAAPDESGHINYELNGTKVNTLDNMGQNMLNEAIQLIIKSDH